MLQTCSELENKRTLMTQNPKKKMFICNLCRNDAMCISKGTTVRQKYFGTLESPRFEQTKQHGTVVAPAQASDFVSNCASRCIIEHYSKFDGAFRASRECHCFNEHCTLKNVIQAHNVIDV